MEKKLFYFKHIIASLIIGFLTPVACVSAAPVELPSLSADRCFTERRPRVKVARREKKKRKKKAIRFEEQLVKKGREQHGRTDVAVKPSE